MIGGGIFINTIGGAYAYTPGGLFSLLDYVVRFRRRRRM